MADKSLSQVLGAGAREVGDIIKTKATALADGKVLLPCDGSTITPASYPLLEALMDESIVATGVEEQYISADDSSMSDNTAPLVRGWKSFVSDDGAIVGTEDDDADFWFQNAAAAAEVAVPNSVSNNAMSNVAGAGDGNELLMADINATGITFWSTITGAVPTLVSDISGGGTYTTGVMVACNRAGSAARVVSPNTNGVDLSLDTWASGSDIRTGWTESFNPTYTTVPTGEYKFPAWSDDFATMCFYATEGLWITRNGGSSWSEQVALPQQEAPYSIAVSDADAIYVIPEGPVANSSGDKIYVSTTGTTFTELVNAKELLAAADEPIAKIGLLGIWTDASDNIVVLAEGAVGTEQITSGVFKTVLMTFYSADAGVTWVGKIIDHAGKPSASANTHFSRTYSDFQMSPDCTRLMYIQFQGVSTNSFKYYDLVKGLNLPFSPSYKIVADAP